MNQFTIANPVQCSGIGLHSGKMVNMTLRPAPVDSGIRFYAVPGGDEKGNTLSRKSHCITPAPQSVIATGLATTLGNGEISISTVEHLLAALRGLAIDNIRIDVEGGELPIMDGSAASFALLLKKAGFKRQAAPRKVWRIRRPVSCKSGEKSIQAKPHDGFFVDYTINFPHPAIGAQRLALEITPETFAEIAKARTFGMLRDVEMMNANGLALGGSLDNAIVLDDHGVINREGLRFPDEFVRHKILDFVGDMAMLDLPLQGHFVVSCSGHALNNQFLRTVAENAAIYLSKEVLETPVPQSARRPAAEPAPLPQMGVSRGRVPAL